jgi:hypothetical protein
MKKILFLIFSMAVFLTSCEEDVNDWKVDSDYERLFKSLVFDLIEAEATSVELKYTESVSATEYVFEFSEDSLEFNNIVKTVKILADTLTPYSESSTTTRTEYRTIFSNLAGTTGYSVRMKSINSSSALESDYSELYFETSAEQIFSDWTVYTNKIEISWTQTDGVTNITVVNDATEETVMDKTLTDDEIANAKTTLENLDMGTSYTITIYNDTKARGRKTLQTLGLEGSTVIEVASTDAVSDLISNAVSAGNTNITLLFAGGTTYEIGSLTIPSGVSDLSFTGETDDSGTLPTLNMTEVRFSDLTFGDLIFENIITIGDYGKYFIFADAGNTEINQIYFRSCEISTCRSLLRLKNTISVKNIIFNDCMIDNIGGYGVVNIGSSSVSVDTLAFSNSTLTELSTQLMDVRTSISKISISSCTFCNLNTAMSQLLRLDTNNLPLSVVTADNIFAGTNSGATINSLSFDVTETGLDVSFGGSYITSDLEINKYEFDNITTFDGTTYELFVDPDNGDFTINSDSGFGGKDTAGDPRWFDND